MNKSKDTLTTSVTDEIAIDHSLTDQRARIDGPYAKYVLAVLVLMSVFNFIDRQIFAILAEEIKADLQLSDGDLGFLFGTAFAVFYAVFGIPLGRLADSWHRTKQISLAVGFWSFMTALSGLVKSFVPLAMCRFGVAAGEAGASPAALSLLYDYFSPKRRTTVVGIYGAGVSIGAGIGLFLGGAILNAWSNAWPDPSLAPFSLKGWQAAFLVVGLPGLLLSILIWTLREPQRGSAAHDAKAAQQLDGASLIPTSTKPIGILLMELLPMLPGVNLWVLQREGASSMAKGLNLAVGLSIILVAVGLVQITGSILQWSALGIGLYCAFSWAQVLICRDPTCFELIFKCKTVRYLYLFFWITGLYWGCDRVLDDSLVSALLWRQCFGGRYSIWTVICNCWSSWHDIGWANGRLGTAIHSARKVISCSDCCSAVPIGLLVYAKFRNSLYRLWLRYRGNLFRNYNCSTDNFNRY